MEGWRNVDKPQYGIAKTNFHQEKPHRLDLDVGDSLIILRESSNWYYGYNKKNRVIKGIFPKSYVQLVESILVKNELVIKRSEIVDEITSILGEWQLLFKKFYLENHTSFPNIRQKMLELIKLRAQMLSGTLPVDEMKDYKLKATAEIDTGNKLLGIDMVVRDDNGNILDINSTSTTQLYEHHVQAVDRIRRATTISNKNRTSRSIRFSHNLLISVHNFVCKMMEDTELLFTLYDGDESKSITENYLVRWSRQGMARDIDQFNNLRVLFTDLSSQDLNRNKIYLVAYVVRIGAMEGKDMESRRNSVANAVMSTGKRQSSQSTLNSSGTISDRDLRRPFGVAALDLTPIIKKPEDFRPEMHLEMPFVPCEKESMDNTLKKLMNNKDLAKPDSRIYISVELLHGDLKQIKEEFPHLLFSNVAFARKMGFPEVIFPGDVRNDLYLTLVSGEFSKGNKSSEKNVEVCIVVCNEIGEIVSGVITQGGGATMTNDYRSVIYYHDDKPKWNETFRINVPIEEFKQCHLRFTFKHRSSNDNKDKNEKPFAMAYVKLLQDNGTTLHHEKHKLLVYKIDYKKYDKDNQFNYLSLPSRHYELLATPKPSAVGFTLLPKDCFEIKTNLCSTKLTQDVNLLGLLNWSSHKETLEESLQALIEVKSEEIVKFLQDILDALFNILVQNDDPLKYDNHVFTCLLRLIEIVSEQKYLHFQSVLDLYINESFSATLAYEKLMNVLERHLMQALNIVDSESENSHVNDGENPSEKRLYKTIKNLQYVMKFIIRSRILFANLYEEKDKLMFETRLEDLLTLFVQLISTPNDLLRSQGAILKYLHVIAADLMQVYDPLRLSNFIVDMITHIPQGRLNLSKMLCIKDLVDSKLFRNPDCRAILLPVFCRQIKDKLESKEEGDAMVDIWQQEKNLTKAAKVLGESKSQLHTRETTAKTKMAECVNIMNLILEILFQENIGPVENDIRDIMLCLLRTVIQSSIAIDRDNPLVGNLVAIMLGIFRNMNEFHYKIYVNNFNTRIDLQDFLTEILLVFKDLVSKPVFSSDWMDMIMHQNTVILESLRHFAKIIMEHFFDPFEKQVWGNFFHCSIQFLIQPALQLDQFSNNKKSMILSRYRDIRRATAYEIRKMWFNLGEHKVQFVPQLVGALLEMSMIPEMELRKATIPIFFDMMQCEYYSSRLITESFGDTKRNQSHIKGNFSDFEKEMIEKIDILVEGGRGDLEYKELFSELMLEYCMEHNTLKHDGRSFVMMATKLMERLLEYRFLINDESKENRMACTVSLLQFYSEVNRKEMYIRYVNKLCDLHMEFDNFTEAAFTLKLHSNLLHWDETQLQPLLRSHRFTDCITHRQLKEKLYYNIIGYFDKGKMWECALELCKELANEYESQIYNYMGLSDLYNMMSIFYKKILTEMRHESEYFRVAFYGLKFPEFLRNRTFIYRGKEYERLSSFCTRILSQHPKAELMQSLTSPGPEITNNEGQFIQINSVEPVSTQFQNFPQEKKVAQPITKYYKTNNVDSFKFSRPYRDNSKCGPNDDPESIGNLWLERTIMHTELPLPGILRWFPVEKTESYKISPIQYAIETMESTNKVIRELYIEHKIDNQLAINPLSMKINGIVDPAVMGGFSKYEDAFLTKEYLENNPEDAGCVDILKNLIAEQIPILELAIEVHKTKAPLNLQPFHERLETCFLEMKQNVESKYGKRTSDIKMDKDTVVVLRRQIISHQPISLDPNRLSETSMGSSDSGFSKAQPTRPQIVSSAIKSTIFNTFNTPSLSRTSLVPPANKKAKEKTPSKRRNSRKMDREALSLPVANSQWYTIAATSSMLATISQTPTEKESITAQSAPIGSPSAPVFELTEELTPKRPLRSEAEKEKRMSRPQSMAVQKSADNVSMSGESSNRNSIITTDSTASEESDLTPPPLPVKTRDSDYSNLPTDSPKRERSQNSSTNTTPKKAMPAPIQVVNYNYEYLEVRNHEMHFVDDSKKRPPTPPPKPARNSKNSVG